VTVKEYRIWVSLLVTKSWLDEEDRNNLDHLLGPTYIESTSEKNALKEFYEYHPIAYPEDFEVHIQSENNSIDFIKGE
jgi:hypothetical protein